MPDTDHLTYRIREALARDGTVQNPHIRVTFFPEAVALAGEVPTASAKRRAEEIVREQAPGYRVDNALVVASNRPLPDAELYSRAQVLLARQPGIPDTLGVQIDRGVARLQGEAPDVETVETAVKLLSRLNGIVSVNWDQVRIPHREAFGSAFLQTISETDLANQFAAALQAETGLYERVFADFEHDKVTLTGVVRNDQERIRAEQIAFGMPGIRTVTNQLITQDGSSDGDERIAQLIRRRLGAVQDGASAADIKAFVVSGTAYLMGQTDRPEGREQAEHLARSTEGVHQVINHVRVIGRFPHRR